MDKVSKKTIPQDELRKFLIWCKVPTRRKGYNYLLNALEIYTENPSKTIALDVYPEVAKRFNVSASAVDGSIRDALQEMSQEIPDDRFISVFGSEKSKVFSKKGLISNVTFIKGANEYLSIRYKLGRD